MKKRDINIPPRICKNENCKKAYRPTAGKQKYCCYKCRTSSVEFKQARKENWEYMKDIYRPKKVYKKYCFICDEPYDTTYRRQKRCGSCIEKKLDLRRIEYYKKTIFKKKTL